MPKFNHTPQEKTERLRPRKSTDKRGGMIDPEGVSPAGPSPYRRRYKRGVVQDTPKPEVPSARRRSGSHLENTIESDTVEPIASGPSGDSRTMQNPLK